MENPATHTMGCCAWVVVSRGPGNLYNFEERFQSKLPLHQKVDPVMVKAKTRNFLGLWVTTSSKWRPSCLWLTLTPTCAKSYIFQLVSVRIHFSLGVKPQNQTVILRRILWSGTVVARWCKKVRIPVRPGPCWRGLSACTCPETELQSGVKWGLVKGVNVSAVSVYVDLSRVNKRDRERMDRLEFSPFM